ncbi:hypothetical protein MKZ38_001883 [Zalerion maritima]|uniref:Uncharacterized protein n=1 Tax=Zalerion maritima TaxID=339359 RepID=A0AAD5WTI7_9PEZI|nr:hypothetical protein MKZ38_001883 [Zalerion maritima]
MDTSGRQDRESNPSVDPPSPVPPLNGLRTLAQRGLRARSPKRNEARWHGGTTQTAQASGTGIRDHWDSPESSKARACDALCREIGYPVVMRPEWSILAAEIGDAYQDKAVLAGGIATLVECFCVCMKELVESEEEEGVVDQDWSERMVDYFSSVQQVRLFLEVSSNKKKKKTTTTTTKNGGDVRLLRKDPEHGIVVVIPRGEQVPGPTVLMPRLKGDLAKMFGPGGGDGREGQGDGGGEEDGEEEEPEWTDVVASGAKKATAGSRGRSAGAASAVADVEYLPNPGSMPSPEELLSKPPYHLLVREQGGEVVVECSHSGTLKVLAEWFGKWGKINHHDHRRPPMIKAELVDSCWGLGTAYERLTLSPTNRIWRPSATTVLALVEGSLGYAQVDAHAGTYVYRKDAAFKSLRC